MERLTKFPEGTCFVVYTNSYIMRVKHGGYDCYLGINAKTYSSPAPDGRTHALEPKDCVTATEEQIDWIEACIEAKKFVPKDDSNMRFYLRTKQSAMVEVARGALGRLSWTEGTERILGMLKDDSVIVPPQRFSHIKTLSALKSFMNDTNTKRNL